MGLSVKPGARGLKPGTRAPAFIYLLVVALATVV